MQIPFKIKPFKHKGGDYALAGLSQKTIIFGRTMVMWAGWQVLARGIVERIREASDDGELEINLEETIKSSGYSDSELEHVSIIYHYRNNPNIVSRYTFNCPSVFQKYTENIVGAGTGLWNFFENMWIEGDDVFEEDEGIIVRFIAKIATHSIAEFDGFETLDHLYGGWFEQSFASSNSFGKIPYAIKFWSFGDGILGSGGPTVFGWYQENVLIVSRFDPFEVDGNVQHHQNHFHVPDFLNRDRPTGPPSNPIRPTFIMHVVVNEKDLSTRVFVDPHPEEEQMIVEVSERGVRIAWKNELREKLIAMAQSDPTLTVYPRFG